MKKNYKKMLLFLAVMLILLNIPRICFASKSNETKEYRNYEFNIMDNLALIFQDELYFQGENNNVTKTQKEINNYLVVGISSILIIYWIILLFIFEKEEDGEFSYENSDDILTLKKYNPLIAACLADNRQVLPRDVIAVILNLIKKDYIKMEMIPNTKNEKENYIYMISENKQKKDGLDRIEAYVLGWIFGFYEEDKVDLIKKLKELSKRKDFIKHIKELDNIAQKELHEIGANIPRVPNKLRIFNVILAIGTIIMASLHIMNNGISVQIYQSTVWLLLLIIACILFILPIVALTIHLILILIVFIKKILKSTTDKYSGKKIIQTSALILFFTFICIGIIYLIVPNKYICLDILMIGIAILIVKTDNLMTKHDKEILNDYYALNEIKYRIEEYSLIKDEQINYIKIWDEYLIYAVAFGIPIPIVNKLQSVYKENEDLSYLAKCEGLYYICKAYLEVMWEMNFKKGTNIFNFDSLFGTEKIENTDKKHFDFYKEK